MNPRPEHNRGSSLGKLYAGFIGGPATEECWGIAVDTRGAVYVTGSAEPGFPTKGGGPTAGYGAFVTKVAPDGMDLVYSVVIGGTTSARGTAIAVDGVGAAYVTGQTRSDEQSFPVRIGPDLTHNGGVDTFVAKLDPTGGSLVFCGYVGGAGADAPSCIALDANNNVYIGGATNSDERSFPVAVGPDLTLNSVPAWVDGFVCRVNASGRSLDYCGYIGGDRTDSVVDIAVDAQGRAYIVGDTFSSNGTFPVAVGPRLSRSGPSDGFIARVNPTGNVLEYSGFIGGASWDCVDAVAVDSHGAAFVGGGTESPESSFLVKHGPDLTHNGLYDGFVAKVRPDGSGLVFAGFIGGDESDSVLDLALGNDGSVFVSGVTRSRPKTFPLLVGPDLTWNYSPTANPRPTEGFVSKLAITLIERDIEPRPGETVTFRLSASEDAGRRYQVGSSLAAGKIPIDTRELGLASDALLALSVGGLAPNVFGNYAGTIGPGGSATATLNVPTIPALVGTKIYTSFITLDPRAPSGASNIANTEVVTVR